MTSPTTTLLFEQLHYSKATGSLSGDASDLQIGGNMTEPIQVQGKHSTATFNFVKPIYDTFEEEVTGWEYYSQDTKLRLYIWND